MTPDQNENAGAQALDEEVTTTTDDTTTTTDPPADPPAEQSIDAVFDTALSLDDRAAVAVAQREEVQRRNDEALAAAQQAEEEAKLQATTAWESFFDRISARAATSPVNAGPFKRLINMLLIAATLAFAVGCEQRKPVCDADCGCCTCPEASQPEKVGDWELPDQPLPVPTTTSEVDRPVDPVVQPADEQHLTPIEDEQASTNANSRVCLRPCCFQPPSQSNQQTQVPYLPQRPPRGAFILRLLGQPQSVPPVTWRGAILHRLFPPPRAAGP